MASSAREREPGANSTAPAAAESKPTWGFDPEAYRLGAEVRLHYCQLFSRLQSLRTGKPHRYHPGDRWDGEVQWGHPRLAELPEPQTKLAPPVWLRLGELCRRHALNPLQLVRGYFDLKAMFQTLPRPDMILRDENLMAKYDQIPGRLREKLEHMLQSERSLYFSNRGRWLAMDPDVSPGRLRQRVLLSDGNGLSALFRYCWAAKFRKRQWDVPICRIYFDAACWQYVQLPELYDETWQDLIPRRFPARAQQWLEEEHAQA